jgi:hypothetical protein
MLAITSAQGAENMSPEEITLAFIRDYKEWNDYAMELDGSGDEKAGWNIGKAYDDIILKYCRKSLEYQPLAYGSESSHAPENEKVLKVEQGEHTATVHTKHERMVANVDLSNLYEYSFEKEAGRWYLVSVAVVIDGEKYDGL